MITIVDYGVGNINAFVNLYKRLDLPVQIARKKEDFINVEKLILPGVGHFDYSMKVLNQSGMRDILDESVLHNNIPVIGICVGMQMMAGESEEGKLKGLGWIDGKVRKINETKIDHITKLPHMGWNDVKPVKDSDLFKNMGSKPIFYFLHNYYFQCDHLCDVIATTEYGEEFSSAVHHKNIYGIQFHPEKSHHYGEKLLYNFAKL